MERKTVYLVAYREESLRKRCESECDPKVVVRKWIARESVCVAPVRLSRPFSEVDLNLDRIIQGQFETTIVVLQLVVVTDPTDQKDWHPIGDCVLIQLSNSASQQEAQSKFAAEVEMKEREAEGRRKAEAVAEEQRTKIAQSRQRIEALEVMVTDYEIKLMSQEREAGVKKDRDDDLQGRCDDLSQLLRAAERQARDAETRADSAERALRDAEERAEHHKNAQMSLQEQVDKLTRDLEEMTKRADAAKSPAANAGKTEETTASVADPAEPSKSPAANAGKTEETTASVADPAEPAKSSAANDGETEEATASVADSAEPAKSPAAHAGESEKTIPSVADPAEPAKSPAANAGESEKTIPSVADPAEPAKSPAASAGETEKLTAVEADAKDAQTGPREAMSDLAALLQAVLDAEAEVKNCDRGAYQELKAVARPPPCLDMTCKASKILLQSRDAAAGTDADGMSFGSSATVVLCQWFSPQVHELVKKHVHDAPPSDGVMEELKKMRQDNPDVWNKERAQRESLAGAVVLGWMFAVLDYCERCKELGEVIQVPTKWDK